MLQPLEGKTFSIVLLMSASAILYVAQRLACYALARPDGSDPGRRAIAQWLPIAAAAITAILWRGNDPQLQKNLANIALSIVFGTSVACLSLVAGMVTFLAPLHVLPPSKKVWPFVFPAALLALMAGFTRHLAWWHGLMLLTLGVAILLVWLNSPEGPDGSSENHLEPFPATLVILGVAVICGFGAIMAVYGTMLSSIESSRGGRMLSPGTVAATILSPLLVLPTLGTASSVAQRGYPGRALTALIGTVLLNICALLPIVIFLWYLRMDHWHFSGFKEFVALFESAHALPYELSIWRIETVILVLLGFALVPISMGRWLMGYFESSLLVIAYALYIVVLVVFGLQMI